jgi:aldehyde dehydrogenase (NAD+)
MRHELAQLPSPDAVALAVELFVADSAPAAAAVGERGVFTSRSAAAAPTVTGVQLELGGKIASIILDDVPEDYVTGRGNLTSMIHTGQGCAIQTRLVLPEHLPDAFVAGARESLSHVKVGDPRQPDTMVGPLIREQQRLRVE